MIILMKNTTIYGKVQVTKILCLKFLKSLQPSLFIMLTAFGMPFRIRNKLYYIKYLILKWDLFKKSKIKMIKFKVKWFIKSLEFFKIILLLKDHMKKWCFNIIWKENRNWLDIFKKGYVFTNKLNIKMYQLNWKINHRLTQNPYCKILSLL